MSDPTPIRKPQIVTVLTAADTDPQTYPGITSHEFNDEWLKLKVGVATRALIRVDDIVWVRMEDECAT